eukprot:364804-Chlamydomonas_euryale.AAC.11
MISFGTTDNRPRRGGGESEGGDKGGVTVGCACLDEPPCTVPWPRTHRKSPGWQPTGSISSPC